MGLVCTKCVPFFSVPSSQAPRLGGFCRTSGCVSGASPAIWMEPVTPPRAVLDGAEVGGLGSPRALRPTARRHLCLGRAWERGLGLGLASSLPQWGGGSMQATLQGPCLPSFCPAFSPASASGSCLKGPPGRACATLCPAIGILLLLSAPNHFLPSLSQGDVDTKQPLSSLTERWPPGSRESAPNLES